MIKYGLISETDARTLEKTMDLIIEQFSSEIIYTTEIGVYSGQTSCGIRNYLESKGKGNIHDHTGIDNGRDCQDVLLFPSHAKFIRGNSDEVYCQIKDNSQHLIFVDGCHCFAHVISDFFCYAPKVKVGGYFAFHDTGEHIKPMKDFQHGDRTNPDAYISVRRALEEIAMLGIGGGTIGFYDTSTPDWQLVFDEADPENEAGGLTVFKKLY